MRLEPQTNLPEGRFDAFIIWGNGVPQKEAIVAEIRRSPYFRILRIQSYRAKSIAKFVRQVYENDFVPFEHLQSKTEYLLKTDPEVVVVIALNMRPNEQLVGKGEFRQTQCLTVKELKETIRDKFNPRVDGKRTEEHVIHATDVEFQTDHLLRLVGIEEGLAIFRSRANPIIEAPYHLSPFLDFDVASIPFRHLYCNILVGGAEGFSTETRHIDDSPHYRCLVGEEDLYERYLESFGGHLLVDDHLLDAFRVMADGFSYLAPPHEVSYVIARKERPDRYVILDGLHRASIVRSQGDEALLVAVTA